MSSPGKNNKTKNGSSKNSNSKNKSTKTKQQKPGSIEAAVAALLLTGKLKVDSRIVQGSIRRHQPDRPI